jgi:hypothetical protein
MWKQLPCRLQVLRLSQRVYEDVYLQGLTRRGPLKLNRRFGGIYQPLLSKEGFMSKPNIYCCLLHAGFFLGLVFIPEDGGDVFLRNVGRLWMGYTAFCRRSKNSLSVGYLKTLFLLDRLGLYAVEYETHWRSRSCWLKALFNPSLEETI